MDASLKVDRQELKRALKTFRQTIDDREWRSAFVEFEDGSLVIECGGVEVRAEASGYWPGRARISSSLLSQVGSALPEEDPLMIEVDEDQLRMGSLKVNCGWDTTGQARIHVPLHTNLMTLLKISRRYDEEIIRSSGIAGMVSLAEDRLREKLDRVSQYLENLGVTRRDLEEIVERELDSLEEPDSLIGPGQKRMPLRYDGQQLTLEDEVQ